MMERFIFGNIRVEWYGGIVRVERAFRGKFCDEDTFFVPDRASLAREEGGEAAAEGNVVRCGEYALYIPASGRLHGLRLEKNGKTVYRYRPLPCSGELPPPPKTPDVFAVSDRPRILLPKGGYSAKRRGNYRISERAEDVYLLLCGKDAKCLRRLYVDLTGRWELMRLPTFGSWNSKYYAYDEETAKALILKYEECGVPLDCMVIDTDWRRAENGVGYEVNTSLFPDMRRFISFAHSHGVEIMFNDHPEPQDGAHVFEPREIAFREKSLCSLLEQGLDIWWYDRNWHTHLISPTQSVAWETFGLYLYHDITERYFRRTAKGAPRRPVVMGNVVNVLNGEYIGISDPASHRYGIQWTGDIASSSCDLAQEVKNLVLCSENCIPYAHADCGGHTGNPDKDQFIRWMQFGNFSPVFRPHCTNSVLKTREPWLYDEETLSIVKNFIFLRYRLMPYLYSQADEARREGIPMFRSLTLEYPADRRAARTDEYLFGRDILVAPMCGAVVSPLSEEEYISPVEATFYAGRNCEGEPLAAAVWKSLRMCLRHVPPAEGVPVYDFSARVRTKISLREAARLYIKNDDGATVRLDGKLVLEDRLTHSAALNALADLSEGGEHTLEIEYFQGGGEAFLGLYRAPALQDGVREVYLPAGRWMDVFDGTVYTGKRTVCKKYPLRAMPLFVRLGAIIPLAKEADRLKNQRWDELFYDFYPDRGSADRGALYEDDGETTAYLSGACRRSGYSAEYLPSERAFSVKLGGAKGSFGGERAVALRNVTVRYHLLKGASRVKRVLLDGAEVPFRREGKGDFPFAAEGGSADADVLLVTFPQGADEAREVKFLLA